MTRKRIQFVISLFITFFFLYLAFRGVSWGELWTGLGQVNYLWTLPFMAVTLLSMYFRTVRWKYLLEPVVNAPSRKFFSPLIICFTLNSMLPGRVGEFARAYLVGRDHKVPFSSAFATVIVERMYDGVGLLILFVAIIPFVDLDPAYSEPWSTKREIAGSTLILLASISLGVLAVLSLVAAWIPARTTRSPVPGEPAGDNLNPAPTRANRFGRMSKVLFAVAGACLAGIVLVVSGVLIDSERVYTFGKEFRVDSEMLRELSNKLLVFCVVLLVGTLLMLWSPFRRFVQQIISLTPLLPKGLKDGLNRVIDRFTEGFHSLRSPRIVFWVVFHTGTVWLTVGWSLVIMAYGFPDIELDMLEGMAVAIIICIAILIPAAPGYWGLYEIGCILGLLMLGAAESRAQALSYSLVCHFLQMLPVLILGLWFMWRRQVGLAELSRAEQIETPPERGVS